MRRIPELAARLVARLDQDEEEALRRKPWATRCGDACREHTRHVAHHPIVKESAMSESSVARRRAALYARVLTSLGSPVHLARALRVPCAAMVKGL